MNGELATQISNLRQGDHVCMIYDTREDQAAAAIPFIAQGLERGEQCLYVADDQTIDDVTTQLLGIGVDVAAEENRRALSLVTKREAYLRTGEFAPRGMIDYLRDTVRAAVDDGFSGFRVTGEMTWALGSENRCKQLIEYEAMLNEFFPDSRALAICQYNSNRFLPEVIYDVLRTHPQAIIGNEVCPNLYFEPPDLILGNTSMAHRVEWMKKQLHAAREAEQKIKRFNAELERAVREKTASLEESRSQLEHFSYALAHDLRAPLRSLQSFTAVLIEDYTTHLDAQAHDYARRIQQSAAKLQEMIDNLLQFSRVTGEQITFNIINLTNLVTEAWNDLAQMGDKTRAALRIERPLACVRGNYSVLKLALTNLFANALKFVPAGRTPEVKVWTEDRGGCTRLSVQDNGIGIDREHLDRIFGMFERLHSNDQFAGTGMGLAIVRKSVERMNGRVGVDSELGKGSTFWIELPTA